MANNKIIKIFFFFGIMLSILYTSCERIDIVKIIKIETLPVENITSTAAILKANIIETEEGIDECGYYYWEQGYESNISVISDTITRTGMFSFKIGNLKTVTKYFVKAFATNSKGTYFGNVRTFTRK
jgi:methylthioribose-1-phosphate isomerase